METETKRLKGDGTVIGVPAPQFTLKNHLDESVSLKQILEKGPVILAFYPGDFTMVCTKQLCSYQGSMEDFQRFGIQVYGISSNPKESHERFIQRYKFTFPLLSDPTQAVAKAYGCTSLLMLGGVSRAVFIVSAKGIVLYRYVEPTVLTHRSAKELVAVISDLKLHGFI